jgi:hypothetical protein
MNSKWLLMCLLLLPQLATAGVFMCKDPASGKTVFTDRGCDSFASREEVRVGPTNVDSGSRTAAAPTVKTWKADLDTRKTGQDLNQEYKLRQQGNATAQIDSAGLGIR